MFSHRATTSTNNVLKKGVTYDPNTGDVLSCLFCRISSHQEPGKIVYEDTNFVAFKTIAPVTEAHILITPRKHIQNLSSLSGPTDALLVKELVRIGRLCLGSEADNARYCFHAPPWNSIDHLHLHAIAKPGTMDFLGMLKYSPESYWCKSAEAVIQYLEVGQDRPPPATTNRVNESIKTDDHSKSQSKL
jgi:diadenosine tetraphosphate (Ap4A) HIT family hydrolase